MSTEQKTLCYFLYCLLIRNDKLSLLHSEQLQVYSQYGNHRNMQLQNYTMLAVYCIDFLQYCMWLLVLKGKLFTTSAVGYVVVCVGVIAVWYGIFWQHHLFILNRQCNWTTKFKLVGTYPYQTICTVHYAVPYVYCMHYCKTLSTSQVQPQSYTKA